MALPWLLGPPQRFSGSLRKIIGQQTGFIRLFLKRRLLLGETNWMLLVHNLVLLLLFLRRRKPRAGLSPAAAFSLADRPRSDHLVVVHSESRCGQLD